MQLPDEILRQIFSHVDSHDIDQKFRLSQVCSQWRTVAVSQRFLWNRLSVMTPLDGQRLPLVLERSGLATLDIKLLWQYRYKQPMLTPAECIVAATQLARCLGRLRCLVIDISRTQSEIVSDLIDAGLSFPVLEDLEIQSSLNRTQRCDLSISAPRLQRLVLYEMGVVEWQPLLARSLTYLSLEGCFNADINLLDVILRQCPDLRSLILRNAPFEAEFPGFAIPAAQQVPHLKVLDLRADVVDLATALRSGFRGMPLDELTTEMYNGFVDDETKQLLSNVLEVQAMTSPHSLQIIGDQEIVIRNEGGRTARMKVWNEDGHWSWPDVWQELASQHGARDSMKKFQILSMDWNVLAGAFSACPPLANGIEIHIDLNSGDVLNLYDFEYDDQPVSALEKAEVGLRYMRCSTLRKIVFMAHEDWRGNSGGSHRETIIQLLKAMQFDSAIVEVCLTDSGLDGEMETVDELRDAISDILKVNGRYILCSHCSNVQGLTDVVSYLKLD